MIPTLAKFIDVAEKCEADTYWREAFECASDAVKEYPNEYLAHLTRGRIISRWFSQWSPSSDDIGLCPSGAEQWAYSDLCEAIKLKPDCWQAFLWRARLVTKDEDKYDDYRATLKLKDNDPEFYYEFGQVAYRLTLWGEAWVAFEHACRLSELAEKAK